MASLITGRKWLVASTAVLAGLALAVPGYYRMSSQELPITHKVNGVEVTLERVEGKPGGKAEIVVTARTDVPDLELGRIQANGSECSLASLETIYPNLDRSRLSPSSRMRSSSLNAAMARKVFTNTAICERRLLFNTVVVTQPVYIQRRAVFRFDGVSAASLPVTRKIGNAGITLKSIFVGDPSAPTWPLGPGFGGKKRKVLALVVQTDFPEGYVPTFGCEITDANGDKHTSDAEGPVSEIEAEQQPAIVPGSNCVYIFEGLARIPDRMSIEITGTLPAENKVLVRFPRVRVNDSGGHAAP